MSIAPPIGTEANEIFKIFHEPLDERSHKRFSKIENVSLLDNNSQVSSYISFNLENFKSSNILLANSYFIIPIHVKSASGSALNQTDLIAFKESSASLISSIIVKAPNASTIIQENDGSVLLREIINILQTSKENASSTSDRYLGPYYESAASTQVNKYGQIVFPNLNAAGVVMNTTHLDGTSIGGNTTILSGVLNASYNEGFLNKNLSFMSQAVWNTDGWDIDVTIPARKLSKIFEKMPMIRNFPLQVQLNLSNEVNKTSKFNAFQVAAGVVPVTYAIRGGSSGACKWVFQKCTLNPSDSASYESLMAKGFTYSYSFESCSNLYEQLNANLTNYSYVADTAARNIKRIFIAGYSVGQLRNQNTTDNSGQLLNNPTTVINSIQLKVNGTNYYENPPSTQIEHYDNIEKMTSNGGLSHQKGALLNMRNWLTAKRFYAIDCEKLQDIVGSTPCSIQLDITKPSSTSDMYTILSKMVTVKFSFSNMGCSVISDS